MDLNFTQREQRFREEVRTWLAEHAEHVPSEPRPHGDGPDSRAFDIAWQRATAGVAP